MCSKKGHAGAQRGAPAAVEVDTDADLRLFGIALDLRDAMAGVGGHIRAPVYKV
jgi:hypothetical protein